MVQATAEKSRMHQLYCQYLGAKGDWQQSMLVLSVRRRHSMRSEETWGWFTRQQLITHLGSEALADDLISRHLEAEQALKVKGKYVKCNPDFPERKELWVYKAFKGIEEKKVKELASEANVSMTAEIGEEDAADFMCLACNAYVHGLCYMCA